MLNNLRPAFACAGLFALMLTFFSGSAASQSSRSSLGKATLLSINDVYQIEGVADGVTGGLARVRALRAELERTAPDLLLLHAGDFLSPSFIGRIFRGDQMIDVMNRLDGRSGAGTFDPRLFVTFGNHEFDDSNCTRKGALAELVSKSEFTWLSSNLDFRNCGPLQALHGNPSPDHASDARASRLI